MASTNSQTPSSTPTKWDVFLSFRGKDTRYSFTSHLYSALDRYNIRTFMDDPELRCGEVISDALLEAIQESRTYIVVLSENYASSRWCLDELVEILNRSKTMQRLVIPVFYNIDPSVVGYQTASFEKHFEEHEDRFAGEIERVKNWRLTLRQVADKSGKHVDGKRSEADIVNEIVDEILLQIKPTVLDVARYPVGLNSRVDDITALLSGSTKGVIKIGIYGMGGVGKTTLAKAVFNDQLLLGSFKGSCFLSNVREISGTLKGLETLQQQLINDVLKSKDKFVVTSVAQGTKLIKARICSTKMLVVIDDLDDQKEFNSLVGPFASGSVVIITTRDEETLDNIEVETKYRYRVNVLDDAESETLFFRHALGDTTPDYTQMILSKHILHLAGGLPLALEVFGSYLYNKSKVRWESYIETLQRNPNSTIQQRLMISLNALESDDPLLKKMFLDIACFFIGRKKEEVVEILDTYYFHADDKIDILMKKCLLTINDYNEFRMHDLLQDVGKEIARNNSPDEPEKYSRLWVAKDVCYVLEEHKGTEVIEGIMLHRFKRGDPFKEVSFAMETFSGMSKLRFLSFDDINLTGKFERTLEDLRWFCWSGCPLKCLPFDFRPQKIVILELPRSKMTTMWEVNKVPNAFEKVKTLNMSFSRDLTTSPDFRRLPCLRKLNFEGCRSLKEVHNSIGSLVSLVSLNLNYCENLRSLPDTICNLRALEVLSISDCSKVKELPEELGKIESLKELNAAGLAVSKLPDSIGDLSKLVKLELGYNQELECLPDTICNLRALEVLRISYCSKVKELPEELGKIESLKELNAARLAVSKLPNSIGYLSKLVKLNLGDNQELECIPDTICNLRALEVLHISYCSKVKELPKELGKIESLKELNAARLAVSKLPDSIGDLSKLVKLELGYNKELECLPDTICNLRALEVLHISYCSKVKELSEELGKIESLKELNAEQLAVSKLPDSIGDLRKLVELELGYNQELECLPDTICNLRALEVLSIIDCSKVKELPEELGKIESLKELNAARLAVSKLPDSIGDLSKLVKLELGYNKELECLPDTICNLRALEVLHISYCSKVKELPEELGKIESLKELNAERLAVSKLPYSIGDLSKLVELELGYNKELECLPDTICNLRALEVLRISDCSKVKELPEELGKIESLKKLNAAELAVSKLPDTICNMRSLEILDISFCDKLERLPDQLWKFTRLLTRLNLSGSKITALPSGISQLSNLNKLRLDACDHLLSIAELPPNLTYISANNCTALERLNLSNLKHLEAFSLADCSGLTEILGMGDLNSLKRMNLLGCPSSLPALTLTEPLFKIYSGFEQRVYIWLEPKKFPDWIIQSSVQCSADLIKEISDGSSQSDDSLNPEISSSMNLQPNLSHNYMGMILCFEMSHCKYYVMTSASNISRSGYQAHFYGSNIEIIPRSVFTVTDADHTIKFTSNARRHWIHLLYKNEDGSTSVNVEDERITPSAVSF